MRTIIDSGGIVHGTSDSSQDTIVATRSYIPSDMGEERGDGKVG
jgi:hypothetical protein